MAGWSPLNEALVKTNIENCTAAFIKSNNDIKTIKETMKNGCTIETVQDFLIKLDIKPLMQLMEISIFSLNIDLLMFTKIMSNLVKDFKILSFKVIFHCPKLVKSVQKKSVKNILL